MKKQVLLAMLAGVILSGCGNQKTEVVVREEIAEQMDSQDQRKITEIAQERIDVSGKQQYFEEYDGKLPRPDSCIEGMSLGNHVSFAYIFNIAEGGDRFDEDVLHGVILAYLSVLEDCGYRTEKVEDLYHIYAGNKEIARFICMGVPDVGYRMYFQIME